MSLFADQTVYSGIIALVTLTGVLAAIAVAVIHNYRAQRPRSRKPQ